MIDLLLSKIVEELVHMGYWGVFLASLGLFPVELVIAVFSASPNTNIWLISLVATLGGLVGGIPTYYIGYVFTEEVLYKWLNGKGKFLRIDTEEIKKSKERLRKNAFLYVLITRFIPWLKIVANIAAGYVRLDLIKFSIAGFIGTFVYTLLISFLGLEAGNNWDLIMQYINIIDRWVIIAVIGYLLIFFLQKSKKRFISKLKTKL